MSKSRGIPPQFLLLINVFAMSLLVVIPVIGNTLANIGFIFFSRAIAEASLSHVDSVYWQLDAKSPDVIRATSTFSLANAILPSSNKIRWHLAQLALMQGKAIKALSYVPSDPASDNELQWVSRVIVESRVGNDDRVIALAATSSQYPAIQVISDTVALAYLNQAAVEAQAGNRLSEDGLLRQALRFRPFDISANAHLVQNAHETGKTLSQNEEQSLKELYTVKALMNPDERIRVTMYEAVPSLMKSKVWEPERIRAIVSFWVWQHPSDQALESLLKGLEAQFPQDIMWSKLRHELYARRDALGQVATRSVAKNDQPLRRPEASMGQASGGEYQVFASPGEQEQFLRDTVAEMLGLPSIMVDIGKNAIQGEHLITGTSSVPAMWQIDAVSESEETMFVAGRDSFAMQGSIRISNTGWPTWPSTEMSYFPYYDYIAQVALPVETEWLLLSFRYKVDGNPNVGLIYLGRWGETPFVHEPLTDTAGQWRRFSLVGRPQKPLTDFVVRLRNWGAANVWFSDIEIHQIILSKEPSVCVATPCIRISN